MSQQHMTPERLAEIRALSRELRYPTPEACDNARRELLAEVDRLRREAAWYEPEAVNTATGAPHRATLHDDGTFTVRHNLGCHQYGGRRETRSGKLLCQLDSYLEQTDPDEHPEPGDYWVTVDVFGRSDECVEAAWSAAATTDGSDR